jgi:hypothetical protein
VVASFPIIEVSYKCSVNITLVNSDAPLTNRSGSQEPKGPAG